MDILQGDMGRNYIRQLQCHVQDWEGHVRQGTHMLAMTLYGPSHLGRPNTCAIGLSQDHHTQSEPPCAGGHLHRRLLLPPGLPGGLPGHRCVKGCFEKCPWQRQSGNGDPGAVERIGWVCSIVGGSPKSVLLKQECSFIMISKLHLKQLHMAHGDAMVGCQLPRGSSITEW